MIILALDTTTRGGSVAVADGDRMLAVLPGDESGTHGERLPSELARALEHAGIRRDQVDLLAVATGPGAFTGLRIGLAAIQGLAMTLNKPVIGVSALDALAEQVGTGEQAAEASGATRTADRSEATPIADRREATPTAERSEAGVLVLPWMDAQRGDVFATLIDRASGTTIEPPTASSPQRLLESWRTHLVGRDAIFIGDAAARDAAVIALSGDGRWQTRTPTPLAPQIARLGHLRAQRGEAGSPHTLEPIYVRRPDAEIERERRRGGA